MFHVEHLHPKVLVYKKIINFVKVKASQGDGMISYIIRRDDVYGNCYYNHFINN